MQQLSVDHNIYQNQELARLEKLGINVEKLQNRGKLGEFSTQHCRLLSSVYMAVSKYFETLCTG